jgi:hypothetical protein
VVRVATSDPAWSGVSPTPGVVRRALRSCAAAVGRALRLLGQHYTAGAWSDDPGTPPRDEHGRGV